ncbi:hypothetical protein FSP39_011867 [Pinctada imbricata]|uniref:Inverted formin-2 n=1 Tax=Pinctada imbricata TaxID=66713 RepID=A0AA88YMG3_PINIB|nr:hypothetical protein FSP39_011867 [Pinctada imbricata]
MSKIEMVYRDPNAIKMESQVKRGSPEKCISMFNSSTSLAMFYFLRMKLETAPEGWLQEFLELDGLDSILDSLYHLTGQRFNSVSCTILSLDCVSCIRAILNTGIGLKYMVCNTAYTQKLAHALTMESAMLKKEVYEMLSVVCAYNYTGYRHVLDTLSHLKSTTSQTYRFSVVVNELKDADTAPHKTAVLMFINCIINCTPDLVERNRIRNEFIGLQLLDILNFFRKEDPNGDLNIQLESFHTNKHSDEEAMNETDMDYNSPEDLIDLIQSKIFGTPKMASFINILQDLLSIDTVRGKNGENLWSTIEKYVHQTVHDSSLLPENSPGSSPLEMDALSLNISQGLKVIHDYQEYGVSPWQQGGQKVGQVTANQNGGDKSENDTGVELTPKMGRKCGKFLGEEYRRAYLNHSIYENVLYMEEDESTDIVTPTNKSALLRRYTITKPPIPQPKEKMKTVPLIKLSDNVINKYGSDSVWVIGPKEQLPAPDFSQLEGMFPEKPGPEENTEVTFLCTSTSRNMNLFLSQIEITPEKLLDRIDTGSEEVDLPTLHYLKQVLPEQEEVSLLQTYRGRRLTLGTTEQFILLLADIPDYMVQLQAYIVKVEAAKTMKNVRMTLDSMVTICKVILESPGIKQFLHFVLGAGNFLNHGCLRGDASGYKLSSLTRLIEVKSNTPNHSLLHHLIKSVQASHPEMLNKSFGDLQTELGKLTKQVSEIAHQLSGCENCRTRDKFHGLIEDIKQDLQTVQTSTDQLKTLREKVANFLCEDPVTYDLTATLMTLQQLCKQIQQCQQDNVTFQKQASHAKLKTDQLKSHHKQRVLTMEFGRDVGASSSVVESKHQVLEGILNDLKVGKFDPEIEASGLPGFENLQLSRISMYSEDFHPTNEISGFRTSSAADILSEEPRVASITSSNFTPKSEQPKRQGPAKFPLDLGTSSEQQQRMAKMMSRNLFPAPDVENTPNVFNVAERTLEQKNRRKSHNRSRSDFTDSMLDMEKWAKYEDMKLQESVLMDGHAPIAEQEITGTFDVTTLNLESDGKLLDKNDVKLYKDMQLYDDKENICCVQDGPVLKLPLEKHQLPELRSLQKSKQRGDRKTSLGNIFTRISRAVLKPRNSEPNIDAGKMKKGKRANPFKRL